MLCMPAAAIMKYGALQLSGNVEMQNLIRNSSVESFQAVQQRNTIRLRVDWDWLQNGQFLDTVNIPFIERSKLFLLFRPVYDSIYHIAPGDRQAGQTRYDDLVGGSLANVPGRTRTLLSNEVYPTTDWTVYNYGIREAYVDFKIKDAPVSFRMGRQQVIWGESDTFRLMDIWNPLDVTWHFQQESWDNIRIPLWLGKGLWDIGDVGPLSNTFLEVVYNPGDFHPGINAGFLPQPWALPFPNALRAGQVQLSPQNGTLDHPTLDNSGIWLNPVFDLEGTSLRRGDFNRNPGGASEVGTRFHAVTPQGLEFSLNYLYGRGRGVGASSPFALKIKRIYTPKDPYTESLHPTGHYQRDINNPNISLDPSNPNVKGVIPIIVDAEVMHPYMHIFGLTGNYFEGDYTAAVFRFETAYAMGEPFQTTDPSTLACITSTAQGKCWPRSHPLALGFSPLGYIQRDVWAGMVGFDRPTWIRFLNPKATWFLTGQFFWNYTTGGHVDWLRGNSGAGDYPYFGPVGRWLDGPFKGRIERQQLAGRLPAAGNGDNIRQWEHLITFGATSFYRGGTVVPFIADAWDPVNGNNEFLWNLDYYYTNNFIIGLQQKFYMTYGSKATSNDPWFVGGRFNRRDETGVKLTYQF
jgi:hypothetical protein